MTTTSAVRAKRAGSGWFILTVLVVSAVPLTAGTLRLLQLAGGPALMPADQRIGDAPAPVMVHIVASAVYLLLGVGQFLPALRRRRPHAHRVAGRVVLVAGVLVAGSALWMTLFYAAKAGTGPILYIARIAFGLGMLVFLILGLMSIRARDVAAHRAWMIRAYAVGLAAGTQAFTEGAAVAIFGSGVLPADLGKLAGWVINLAIAEWVIRRMRRHGLRTPQAVRG
jgi:uncharacterized membrane protein